MKKRLLKHLGITLILITAFALLTASVAWFTLREPGYNGKNFSAWLADLDSANPKQRAAAEKAIIEMGTNSLPLLTAEFDLQHHGLRETLRRLLTKAHILKITLPTPDQRFKRATQAFKLLGEKATPALPSLVPLLDQAPGYVPIAMGYIGTNALPTLFTALKHTNVWVQNNSMAALTQMLYDQRAKPEAMKPAMPMLIEKLSGTNDNNQWRASELLQAMGPIAIEASPALQQAASTTNMIIREKIIHSLAVVDPDNSWRSVLELSRQQLKSTNPNTRYSALLALSRLPPRIREPVPLLIACLDDSSEIVRFNAAGALGKYQEEAKEIVPHLIKAMNDTNYLVRLTTATALGNHGAAASNSLPILRLAATNDVAEVKGNARSAVSRIEAALARENRRSNP